MAKTTQQHINKGYCEEKDYIILSRIITDKQIRFIATCPYCGKNKEFIAAIELGKGVRCKCGAMFYKRKCYFYHYHNTKIQRKTPDKVYHLSAYVRCPKKKWNLVNILHCMDCEYKQSMNLETGSVVCKHGRIK
jgi:acetone carboxylase gamma subunit